TPDAPPRGRSGSPPSTCDRHSGSAVLGGSRQPAPSTPRVVGLPPGTRTAPTASVWDGRDGFEQRRGVVHPRRFLRSTSRQFVRPGHSGLLEAARTEDQRPRNDAGTAGETDPRHRVRIIAPGLAVRTALPVPPPLP